MPKDAAPVTLEITLAPSDVKHARHVLPHQLRVWADQVQEIVCTLDTLTPFGKRMDERSPGVRELTSVVRESLEPYPHGRIVVVDPSPDAVAKVGEAFFAGGWLPAKDFRGLGFLSYYAGLYAAASDYVLHTDSDMVFGGGSTTWLQEAVELLEERPHVLACQPLTAPPTDDGGLRGKDLPREPYSSVAHRWADFSTRCYFLDKRTLAARGPLELVPWKSARNRVSVVDWLKAVRSWNREDLEHPLTLRLPPYGFAEWQVTRAMERNGLCRVSMLGSEPGMWTIHPGGVRTERVHELLPYVIASAERGEVPDAQRGRWDLEESAWPETIPSAPAELATNRG